MEENNISYSTGHSYTELVFFFTRVSYLTISIAIIGIYIPLKRFLPVYTFLLLCSFTILAIFSDSTTKTQENDFIILAIYHGLVIFFTIICSLIGSKIKKIQTIRESYTNMSFMKVFMTIIICIGNTWLWLYLSGKITNFYLYNNSLGSVSNLFQDANPIITLTNIVFTIIGLASQIAILHNMPKLQEYLVNKFLKKE